MQPNQGRFQQPYSNMQGGMGGQQYGNYNGNPGNMMQGSMQRNQQMIQGAEGQQGVGQPRQPNYEAMLQHSAIPQFRQPAPNVTMNSNMNTMNAMGAQAGFAPPYSWAAGGQGMQGAQQAQLQQQQQCMRQQMVAMQPQQQQGATFGTQPPPALVAQLQRQMNPNPYQQQPSPYNMG